MTTNDGISAPISPYRALGPRESWVFMQKHLAQKYGARVVSTDPESPEVCGTENLMLSGRDNKAAKIQETVENELQVGFRVSLNIIIASYDNRGEGHAAVSLRTVPGTLPVSFEPSDATIISGTSSDLQPMGHSLTLSEVLQRLTPKKKCDGLFFSKCAESFTSDTKVWSLLVCPQVLCLLEECSQLNTETSRRELANKICGTPTSPTNYRFISYRKVFAILIILKNHESIALFVRDEVHDHLLPLSYQVTSNGSRIIFREDGDNKSPSCFDGWPLHHLERFWRKQSKFCAPFFKEIEANENSYHYRFPRYEWHQFPSSDTSLNHTKPDRYSSLG